jgi:hypothetical protein
LIFCKLRKQPIYRGFFALDAAKNPDYPACLRSLQGKKSPLQAIFEGFMREARQTARSKDAS